MSTVYLARDTTLDRPVAVKVMHREMSEQADQLERFRQEARAVAKLSHPNVVAVIDAGEDGGYPYIVFEYVEGETLKARINRVGALDAQEALAYAIEVARGLTVAHARSMIHRDIKPQNVLIDAEGRAKLTDFGISRQLEQDGMTATGRVLGTTDYVAPEQAMGRGADQRSDIYSLGVVLFEMLTGQVPFEADSQVGVAMKHVNEELPDVQAGGRNSRRRRRWWSSGRPPRTRQALRRHRRDDRRPLHRARGRGGAGGLDHRRGDQRAGGGAAGQAQALERARLVLGGVAAAVLIAAAVVAIILLDSSGNTPSSATTARRRREATTSGKTVALESATAYDPEGDGEEEDETGRTGDRRQPDRHLLDDRALRHRHLRGHQDRARPRRRHLRHAKAAALADQDDDPHPDPRLGRADLRRRPPARRKRSKNGANRSARSKTPTRARKSSSHLGAAAKYFLVWFTKASPAERPGRPLPGRNLRHQAVRIAPGAQNS